MKMSMLSVGGDASPLVQLGGKRARAAHEDEAFLDNFHTHKRYLTEVMASSLNGLKVGEATTSSNPRSSPPLLDAAMVSPAHTETAALSRSASSFPTSHGDDTSTLDSPMSDDSDESVGYRMGRVSEVSPITTPVLNTKTVSTSTAALSPVLPRCNQHHATSTSGHLTGVSSQQQTPPPYTPSLPFPCSQSRVKDSEGRLPPSPSDPCPSADLRRAALMRSLQMRSQSPMKLVRAPSSIITSQTNLEKPELAQVLEVGAQLPPEETGCNSEVLEQSNSSSLFPSVGTRASTRARSLLLDEPNVAATVAVATTTVVSAAAASSSTTQEQEIIKKGMQEASFENIIVQPKGVRGCSKLANVAASDGNMSDSESKPSRRPSAGITKKSCKRAKRL